MKSLFMKKMGYSMVEMLLVIFLVSLLTLLMTGMLTSGFKNYRAKRQIVELEEKAAKVMREFEQTTRAATKVLIAEPNELVFYRYYDLVSPSPSKVRYFTDGNEFKIGITEPFGTEPDITYPLENERIDLIVPDITSVQIFNYYNGREEELTGNFQLAGVKMVKLNISLDKDPLLPPLPVVETTKIMLRNTKDNL